MTSSLTDMWYVDFRLTGIIPVKLCQKHIIQYLTGDSPVNSAESPFLGSNSLMI